MDNIQELKKIAETSKDTKEAVKAMRKLRLIDKTYHWCPDWDQMVICSSDKEAECCTCFK